MNNYIVQFYLFLRFYLLHIYYLFMFILINFEADVKRA